jgi:hypothetical protein
MYVPENFKTGIRQKFTRCQQPIAYEIFEDKIDKLNIERIKRT